jgi:serine protease Do
MNDIPKIKVCDCKFEDCWAMITLDYDVVLEVNGLRVKNTSELIAQITSVAVGQKVTLKVLRGGSEKTIEITASERPTDLKSAGRGGAQPNPKQKKQKQEVDPGMTVEDLNAQGAQAFGFPADTKGVVVTATAYEGPADQAGVLRGDIIVEVDRKPIKDVAGFFSLVKAKKSYLLRVKRLSERGGFNFVVVVLDLKAE